MSPDEEPRPKKEDQKKTRFILIFNPYPSISKQKEMRKNSKAMIDLFSPSLKTLTAPQNIIDPRGQRVSLLTLFESFITMNDLIFFLCT